LAMVDVKKVTRDKLMRALGSHELVVAFENITSKVGDDIPEQIAGLSVAADAAQATADGAATDLAAHQSAADPHPQYLTEAAAGSGYAPLVHAHDASAISTGVMATARLGGGSAVASAVLHGDSQWKAISYWSQSSATQGPGFSADTYLQGSSILAHPSRIKAGTRYLLTFDVSKTAAGTAAPVLRLRFGINADASDAAIITITLPTQTAASDDGIVDVFATFLAVGALAVVHAVARLTHQGGTSGLSTSHAAIARGTSIAFDATAPGNFLGVSIDAGAAAAWTVTLVQSKLENLA
ncbi:MAG TPA: hypothetical protein PLL92_07180, partial [Alicycliphilus sp.]|nr:hypothetical protein [Alicycliphilus sp.]